MTAFRDAAIVLALALASFLLLNANGREIGGYDSQPTKFAARELALRGTLALNRVVGEFPGLADRPAFATAADGRVRSAYPVLPSIMAAGPAWLLARAGVLDLEAPLAPTIIAKITASLLVTLAVVCAYLIARQRAAPAAALVVAGAYGFGTNAWLAGQTLGGHETVAFGLMAGLVLLARPGQRPGGWRAWLAAALLAVAGAARAQVAPAVAVLALSLVVRSGDRRRWLPLSVLALGAGLVVGVNVLWFGHPLGAVPRLEALHPTVHAVSGTFSPPWQGAAGLLVSPSRGLLVFSPVVIFCLAGLAALVREGWRGPLAWCTAAAIAQFGFYASYTVWWGGHSYGPRYAVDALPLLVPLAAAGTSVVARSGLLRAVAVAALCWSVGLAATGAFSYPADRWNTDPADVDRNHERFWDWRDPQFVRCWKAGLSPQNFDLFRADAFVGPPSIGR